MTPDTPTSSESTWQPVYKCRAAHTHPALVTGAHFGQRQGRPAAFTASLSSAHQTLIYPIPTPSPRTETKSIARLGNKQQEQVHALPTATTDTSCPLARILKQKSKMFKRSFGGKDRAGKARKISKRSFRDDAKARMREALNDPNLVASPDTSPSIGSGASPRLNSAIVTICVGKDQRK